MSDDLVLSAWQLYTGLFILFWAAQIYFSSFWMSLLCCIKVDKKDFEDVFKVVIFSLV